MLYLHVVKPHCPVFPRQHQILLLASAHHGERAFSQTNQLCCRPLPIAAAVIIVTAISRYTSVRLRVSPPH